MKLEALHIGCGPIYLESNEQFKWTNTDIQHCFKTDLCYNAIYLTDKITEESIDLIWCCHMLEHLSYPTSAIAFLKVCFTLLKKDGIIRLAVPDLELVSRYYLEKDKGLKEMYANGKFFYMYDNAGERFNYFLKEWEHCIVYDCQMLTEILQGIGFKILGKKGFNHSIISGWNYDRLEKESLYFEAQK